MWNEKIIIIKRLLFEILHIQFHSLMSHESIFRVMRGQAHSVTRESNLVL